jgi:hypothetical protein
MPVIWHGTWRATPSRTKVLLTAVGAIVVALWGYMLAATGAQWIWWFGFLVCLPVVVIASWAVVMAVSVCHAVRSRRKVVWWGRSPNGVSVVAFGRSTADGGTVLSGAGAWPRGTGTAIGYLMRLADASGLLTAPVTLSAAHEKLVTVYEHVGFVATGERSLGGGFEMIRRLTDQ